MKKTRQKWWFVSETKLLICNCCREKFYGHFMDTEKKLIDEQTL